MVPQAIRPSILALCVLLIPSLSAAQGQNGNDKDAPTRYNDATIAQLQADMNSGQLTSVELVNFYLRRMKRSIPA